ncbi:MAG: 50S ribosomal protein L32e [Candidatus Thorarchaeota archaeon]
MSKKPELSDLPGLGPKLEEKLREAGVKTILNLSRAKADKLAAKVDGLSESRAETLIAAAQDALPSDAAPKKEAKPKKAEPKAEKPKAKAEKPKAKAKPKAKPEKKAAKPETPARFLKVEKKLVRITANVKKRKPRFRADQAHRWKRVSDRWRRLRGIDSYTRQKKKGRIAMVESGYRTPKAVRYLHPSLFEEVLVHRPQDLEGLDADIHAVRIGGSVGGRKRQLIIAEADAKLLRVLNPGTTEEIGEEDLFTDLDLEED